MNLNAMVFVGGKIGHVTHPIISLRLDAKTYLRKLKELSINLQHCPTSCLRRGNANPFIFGFGDIFLEYVPEVCWNVLRHIVEC